MYDGDTLHSGDSVDHRQHRENHFEEQELLRLLQSLQNNATSAVVAKYLSEKVSPEEYERERQNALGGTTVTSSYLQSLFNQEPDSSTVRYERFVLPALGARLLVDDNPAEYQKWWTELTIQYPFLEDIQQWHGKFATEPLTVNQRAVFYDVLSQIANVPNTATDRLKLKNELQNYRSNAQQLLERLRVVETQEETLKQQRIETERGYAHIEDTIESLELERQEVKNERLFLKEASLQKQLRNEGEVDVNGDEKIEQKEVEKRTQEQDKTRVSDLAAREEALTKRISLLKTERKAMKERETSELEEVQAQLDTVKRQLNEEIEALKNSVVSLQEQTDATCAYTKTTNTTSVLEHSLAEQIRRTKTAEGRALELEEKLSHVQQKQEQEQKQQCKDHHHQQITQATNEKQNGTMPTKTKSSYVPSGSDSDKENQLRNSNYLQTSSPEPTDTYNSFVDSLNEREKHLVWRESRHDELLDNNDLLLTEGVQNDMNEIRNALEAIEGQLIEAQSEHEREHLSSDKQYLLTELEMFST